MNSALNLESSGQAAVLGYAHRPVTKAPNWHGLVTLDVLFNNLSTGLFLVAALAELVAPTSFAGISRVAFPIALLWLIADLVCLVLDLGDRFRFHHMLRVWKPSSPMSLGTWCLTAFAAPLTVLAVMSLFPTSSAEWLRRVLLILGLMPALGAAVYKGVLFSTTAQPGWGNARWLGGYLSSSALTLGAAQVLVLASAVGHQGVAEALRHASMALLVVNLIALCLLAADLRAPLSRVHTPGGLAGLGALALFASTLVPLWLLALGAPLELSAALVFMLSGAFLVRHEVVRLPHLIMTAATRQGSASRASGPPPSR